MVQNYLMLTLSSSINNHPIDAVVNFHRICQKKYPKILL